MTRRYRLWNTSRSRGPWAELSRPPQRFRAVAWHHERRMFVRGIRRRLPVLATAAAAFALLFLALVYLSPWPAMATLKHVAAFPNCDAARALGLAPARQGEPGYWPRHDRDNDGIACEPWPYRQGYSRR